MMGYFAGVLTFAALRTASAVTQGAREPLIETLETVTESFRETTEHDDPSGCSVSAEPRDLLATGSNESIHGAPSSHSRRESSPNLNTTSNTKAGVRKTSQSPSGRSPLLVSLLDASADAASRIRMIPDPRECGFVLAVIAAVAVAVAKLVSTTYAWLRKKCCERGKKRKGSGFSEDTSWTAGLATSFLGMEKPEDVRVLICIHPYEARESGPHRVYALTRAADERDNAPPKALLNNTQFRDGVPFVANTMVVDSPAIVEIILSSKHTVLQFAIWTAQQFFGAETLAGIASIDLKDLNENFNFENKFLQVCLEDKTVGSLEVSMWKYVEPRGFKVHDMWGRLACCLDQAKKQLSDSGADVSNMSVLTKVLTGNFMVEDGGESRNFEKCYFEAAFKKERWYWVWYRRKGQERKGFLPFGSLISMRADPGASSAIILQYNKKGEKKKMIISPLPNPQTFADAVRGRDELMFALWTLREKRSTSPSSQVQDVISGAVQKEQGASSSDSDGSQASDISRVSASVPRHQSRRETGRGKESKGSGRKTLTPGR